MEKFNLRPFIDTLRQKFIVKLFYWGLRVSLGLTFILSGMRKIPGVLFTTLPVENPIGAYFHAMHETGFYWNFIGYFQILVGVLLFFNRFAPIASLFMTPITVNIFLISVSLHMRGTPYITACMLLGNIFLLIWHYEHYLPILEEPRSDMVRLRKEKKKEHKSEE